MFVGVQVAVEGEGGLPIPKFGYLEVKSTLAQLLRVNAHKNRARCGHNSKPNLPLF